MTFQQAAANWQDKLTHLLYHLRDNRGDIVGILSCESGELFMRYFKEYLEEMFAQYLEEIQIHAPGGLVLNHLAELCRGRPLVAEKCHAACPGSFLRLLYGYD